MFVLEEFAFSKGMDGIGIVGFVGFILSGFIISGFIRLRAGIFVGVGIVGVAIGFVEADWYEAGFGLGVVQLISVAVI